MTKSSNQSEEFTLLPCVTSCSCVHLFPLLASAFLLLYQHRIHTLIMQLPLRVIIQIYLASGNLQLNGISFIAFQLCGMKMYSINLRFHFPAMFIYDQSVSSQQLRGGPLLVRLAYKALGWGAICHSKSSLSFHHPSHTYTGHHSWPQR